MPGIGLNGSLLMGSQALTTQQIAMETIGNNLANINTPGYAQQRANIVTGLEVDTGIGEEGLGATVSDIESIRSTLLDSLVQQSLGAQGYADQQASLTSTVQDTLGEQLGSTGSSTYAGSSTPSGGAVQDALTTFFSAWSTLANDPTDPTAQAQVVQDGSELASAINSTYQNMEQTQSDIASDASSEASQINQLATTIATLNQQIQQVGLATSSSANNLQDTQDNDIDQLSQLVNVTVTTQSNGMVSIALADNPDVVLVDGVDGGGAGTTQSLSVAYDPTADVPLTVSASTTGALGSGVPSGGSLGADLETANNVIGSPGADGDTGILGALDNVASALVTAVNTQSKAGYDVAGDAGGVFFNVDGTGAATISVDSTVADDPSLVATGSGGGPLDGSNAEAISQLQSQATILPAFQEMVSNLGTVVNNAASAQTIQDQVTTQLQAQQQSIEGVSVDEEMTNLISFQQAYDASARFITTIAGMYSTLVNDTGSSS